MVGFEHRLEALAGKAAITTWVTDGGPAVDTPDPQITANFPYQLAAIAALACSGPLSSRSQWATETLGFPFGLAALMRRTAGAPWPDPGAGGDPEVVVMGHRAGRPVVLGALPEVEEADVLFLEPVSDRDRTWGAHLGGAPAGRPRLVAAVIGYADIEVPTYAYRCQANHEFEVVQSIMDDPLTLCPSCGAGVRRVVFPVGIVFKGQGFYKTDSRSSGTGSLTSPRTTAPESAQAEPAAKAEAPAKAEPAAKADVNPAPSGASAGATGTGVKNG